MRRSLVFAIGLFVLLASFSSSLRAQQGEVAEERFRMLEERIRALEAEVQSLKAALPGGAPEAAAAPTAPAPTQTPLQAPAAPLPIYGGAASLSKALNPDIGVIGNFIGAAGRNIISPFPSLSLRESEFSFQAIVDPYARADFFLSVGEEGAAVEEGYITFPALPGGFSLKAGQMRSNFGKINPLHNHVLPWIDRPLTTYNLLGGEQGESDAGIKDAGLSLSRILPAPGEVFLEGTAEVYRGSSGNLFQSNRRSDLSSIFRLRGYKDLSESTNLEIGGSYARGHNDVNSQQINRFCTTPSVPRPDFFGRCTHIIPEDLINARDLFGKDFTTQLFGVDATLRWKPLRRAIYHSFIARTEFVWSRREDVSGPPACSNPFGCRNPTYAATTLGGRGFYASADYQFARRWFGGARVDWAERAWDPGAHDSAQSLVVTYWPSEFSQVRGQLRRTQYAEGHTANELLFQFQYTLGAHGAHPF